VALCWLNDIRQCRFQHGARINFVPTRKPGQPLDDAGTIVFGNTVRECVIGDGPRLPMQNQWYPYWEGWARETTPRKYDRPGFEPAIRLALRCVTWATPTTPSGTSSRRPSASTDRAEFRTGLARGIYESRSARGNVLGTNTIAGAKEDVVRTAGEKPQ